MGSATSADAPASIPRPTELLALHYGTLNASMNTLPDRQILEIIEIATP